MNALIHCIFDLWNCFLINLFLNILNSPIWAQFSTSCVSCPAGWEFSSYRCVTLFDESVGDYDECADMCSNTNDGVMYKFHDVYDLKSVLAETIPSEGLYVSILILDNE